MRKDMGAASFRAIAYGTAAFALRAEPVSRLGGSRFNRLSREAANERQAYL
jgi:hypothetical protein